jgi:hypothetical protein
LNKLGSPNLATPAGRTTQIVAGLPLMFIGAASTQGKASLIALGAIPLTAGAFDFCVISPLFKGPFWDNKSENLVLSFHQRHRTNQERYFLTLRYVLFLETTKQKVLHRL